MHIFCIAIAKNIISGLIISKQPAETTTIIKSYSKLQQNITYIYIYTCNHMWSTGIKARINNNLTKYDRQSIREIQIFD